MWQVLSTAAIVVIAVTSVYKIQQNANSAIYEAELQGQYAVDNAIYACASGMGITRGEISRGETPDGTDIDALDDTQLQAAMPALIRQYEESQTYYTITENGNTLVMAYLRLHNRTEARKVLNQLLDRFGENGDPEDIQLWESILKVIE